MEPSRLARIPLFEPLSDDERAELAVVAAEVAVAAGTSVAVQGDFGHALYAIEEGTADVVVGDKTVRSLGPGDVFGEIAVVASGRRTASVVATSPLVLLAFFKRDVWKLEQRSPEVAERLRELVAERSATQQAARD